MDNVVNQVTTAERMMMTVDHPIPACPATQVSRRYNITPQILSRHRNITPLIQPNLGATLAFFSFLVRMTTSSLLRWPFSTLSSLSGSARGYIVQKQTNQINALPCFSKAKFQYLLSTVKLDHILTLMLSGP